MTRPPGRSATRSRRSRTSPLAASAVPKRGPAGFRLIRLLVLNLLVFVALWSLLELCARMWFPRDLKAVFDNPQAFRRGRPYVQEDARRGFMLRAGYSTPRMTVTRNGFRALAAERQEEQPRDKRIVCLGGSTTFGWGLADHESYPAQLQAQLDAVYPGQVSVLNAGVPSYTSEQVCLYLEEIFEVEPRLVIVQSMWNDLLFSFVDNWFPDLLVHQRPCAWRRCLLKYSAVFRALSLRSKDSDAECRASPKALQRYRSNLHRIIRRCREQGVALVFCMPPLQESFVPEEGMLIGTRRVPRSQFLQAAEEFAAVLQEVAREDHVPLVRHRVERDAHPSVELFLDAAHPDSAGYRLLAEDVTRTIFELDPVVAEALAGAH